MSDVDPNAAKACADIRWALEDQIKFAGSLVANGTVSSAQLEVAIHHAAATGAPIGHALIHTGAITQRQLMSCLERL